MVYNFRFNNIKPIARIKSWRLLKMKTITRDPSRSFFYSFLSAVLCIMFFRRYRRIFEIAFPFRGWWRGKSSRWSLPIILFMATLKAAWRFSLVFFFFWQWKKELQLRCIAFFRHGQIHALLFLCVEGLCASLRTAEDQWQLATSRLI